MKSRHKFIFIVLLVVLQACKISDMGLNGKVSLPDACLSYQCKTTPVSDLDVRIRSFVIREQDVFASTDEGIYRASLQDKEWMQFECPELPIEGRFAKQSKAASRVAYVTRTGIHISEDSGQSWCLVPSEYDFYQDKYDFSRVFLHGNDKLYGISKVVIEPPEYTGNIVDVAWCAIGEDGEYEYCTRERIMVSDDLGQTWEDITGNIGAGISLSAINEDPDHPNQIVLHGYGIRGYVLQAPDEDYDWEMFVDWAWCSDYNVTEQQFFGSGCKYPITLSNFFEQCGILNP